MKKLLLALILIFMTLSGIANGATSDDVYLRKDVFEAKMETLFAKIDALEKRIDVRIDNLEKRIDRVETHLDKRIDDTHNFLYFIMVLVGVLIALPFVQKGLEGRKEKIANQNVNQSLTLEDVKKLINEAINMKNLSVQGK